MLNLLLQFASKKYFRDLRSDYLHAVSPPESANFLRRSSLGLGLGFAAVLYFLNIIANLSDKAAFLKWITPFGFADGAQIAADGTLKSGWVLLGMGFCLAGIAAAYAKYIRKDIS